MSTHFHFYLLMSIFSFCICWCQLLPICICWCKLLSIFIYWFNLISIYICWCQSFPFLFVDANSFPFVSVAANSFPFVSVDANCIVTICTDASTNYLACSKSNSSKLCLNGDANSINFVKKTSMPFMLLPLMPKHTKVYQKSSGIRSIKVWIFRSSCQTRWNWLMEIQMLELWCDALVFSFSFPPGLGSQVYSSK